jgi:NADH:ubiquinone oxidoreductase subunit 6 (subunit J)
MSQFETQGYREPGPGQPGASYEFNDQQNGIIKECSTWLIVVAVGMFIDAAGKMMGAQRSIVGAIITIVVGVLMVMSATSFKKVVDTQGNDVAHLMEALDKFGNVMLVRSILAILAFVGILLIAVIGGAVLAAR